MTNPLFEQVGGEHYRTMAIQPVEYIVRNGIGYIEGCVIKYVSRWRKKNGVEDLKKARHFLDILIEIESEGQSEALPVAFVQQVRYEDAGQLGPQEYIPDEDQSDGQ